MNEETRVKVSCLWEITAGVARERLGVREASPEWGERGEVQFFSEVAARKHSRVARWRQDGGGGVLEGCCGKCISSELDRRGKA